jgi:hypothetical protein
MKGKKGRMMRTTRKMIMRRMKGAVSSLLPGWGAGWWWREKLPPDSSFWSLWLPGMGAGVNCRGVAGCPEDIDLVLLLRVRLNITPTYAENEKREKRENLHATAKCHPPASQLCCLQSKEVDRPRIQHDGALRHTVVVYKRRRFTFEQSRG